MEVCGLDIGYSNMKVVFGGVETAPQMDIHIFPVGAAPAHLLSGNVEGRVVDATQVQVDGEEYVACVEPERLVNWERALHDDYPSTPSYRALFHAALLKTGGATVDRLVTGLPVSHHHNKKTVKALEKRLTGVHQVAPGYAVCVREVAVIPQPVGAYLDVAASSGREEEFADAEVLIVDPGYFSVDWVLMSEQDLQTEWSDSSTQATSRLLEEVSTLIYREYECRVPVGKIERAIRTGKETLPVFRERVALKPLLKQAAKNVAPMVMHSLKSSMRTKAADIGVVILAGGGASFYKDAVEDVFPRSEIILPKDPVTSNASGFWFYGAAIMGD